MSTPKVDLKSLWVNSGRKKYFIALGVTGCLAIGALGSTLAANISLNSGEVVEFGQGIVQTTACSGEDSLTVTPESTFINEVGAGAHYFTSLTVSDIPQSCLGATFTLAAYDADEIRTWSDCTDPGHQLSLLFTETQTVPTDASFASMYSNVTDSDANSFTVTWVSGPDSCDSEILAGDLRALTIQSSGNPVGYVGYVADFTAGQTAFDSQPLVAFDTNVISPEFSLWSNGGSLQEVGNLEFSSDPMVVPDSNSYVEIARGITAAGNVGAIASSADRMSVEMWVNFDDDGAEFDSSIFSFDTSDDRGLIDGCGYNLSFNEGYLGINTCNSDTLGFNASQLNNGWHHIVWIASTSARYTQKIFLNGVVQDLVFYDSGDSDLTENARPNIGNGGFGVNSWSDNQAATYKLGALNIYAGEMPSQTVSSRYSIYQDRLNP
jgi:hypothetical protein